MSRLRQIGVSEGKRLDSGKLSGFWQSLFTFGDTADTQLLKTTQMAQMHMSHLVQIVLDAFAGVEMTAVAVESSDALQGRGQADLQAVHGSALHGSSVISSLKMCPQKLETLKNPNKNITEHHSMMYLYMYLMAKTLGFWDPHHVFVSSQYFGDLTAALGLPIILSCHAMAPWHQVQNTFIAGFGEDIIQVPPKPLSAPGELNCANRTTRCSMKDMV